MPNPILNKLHQFLNTEDPELVSGMQESEFVTQFSNPEKLRKLYSHLEENNPDLLGGMSSDEFETNFGEGKANQTEPRQSSAPRIGVSSPKALQTKAQQHFEGQMEAMVEPPRVGVTAPNKIQNEEKVDSEKSSAEIGNKYINEPQQTARESTSVSSNILDENPLKFVDLREKKPVEYGGSQIKNLPDLIQEGSANPERAIYDIGMKSLQKADEQAKMNISLAEEYINNKKGDENAYKNYISDNNTLSISLESDPEKKSASTIKMIDEYNKKWKDVDEDEIINKYLFGTYDFIQKFKSDKEELISKTPNHQQYLKEINKKQEEIDSHVADNNISVAIGQDGEAARNKITRVVANNFKDFFAWAKSYSEYPWIYNAEEYLRQVEERHPKSTKEQRDIWEHGIEDNGLRYVYQTDEKGNKVYSYTVNVETGMKVNNLTEPGQNIIDKYKDTNKDKSRLNVTAGVSSGADELIQEALQFVPALLTDGAAVMAMRTLKSTKKGSQLAGGITQGIEAFNVNNKYAKSWNEGINSINKVSPIKLGAKASEIPFRVGSLATEGIEGSADYRQEALDAGLSGNDVDAYQRAMGFTEMISNIMLDAKIGPLNVLKGKEREIFLKSKLTDFASGKITKGQLLKESFAGILKGYALNQIEEGISEYGIETFVGNVIKDHFNDKGGELKKDGYDGNAAANAFFGSSLTSLVLGGGSRIRMSKNKLMGDAISWMIDNPNEAEEMWRGRREVLGASDMENQNFLKSALEQVKESGIKKTDRSKAAALILDRQLVSKEIEKGIEKYGKDAPLVKRQKIELEGIEKKLDELFLNEDIPAEAGTEDATLGETPTPKDDKGENGVSAMAEMSETKLKEGDQFVDKNGVEWTVVKDDEVTAKIDGGIQGTTLDSFDPKEIELINKTSINEGDQVLYNGNPHTVHGVHKTATGSNAFSLKDEKGNIVQSENGKISYVNEGSLDRAEKEAAPIQGELDGSPVSSQTEGAVQEEVNIDNGPISEGSALSSFKGDVIERSGNKYKVLGNSKGNNEGTVKLEAISDDHTINGRKSEWNAENNGGFNLVGEIKEQGLKEESSGVGGDVVLKDIDKKDENYDSIEEAVKGKNFVKQTVSIDELILKDKDLQEYLNDNKETKGRKIEKAIIVGDISRGGEIQKGGVIDGFHRIAQAIANGETKIEAYVEQAILTQEEKVEQSKSATQSSNPTLRDVVPSPVKQQKSKSEIVNEINSKNLSHVRGLSMGENQSTGTYISTEKKNRYETEGKKAEKVKVDIKEPYVVQDDTGMITYRNELLNEAAEKFGVNDFEGFEKPNRSNLNIEDLNADGIKKLAKLVAEKLQSEGYDSIYFPESKMQEGEFIVFDRNFVIITDDIQETELTFNKDKKDGFISQSGRQSIIFANGELKVVDVKTGKEVSREVRNKVIGEYIAKFNFHHGESGETNDFDGDVKQYKESVLENSSNPYEILNLYIEEPFEPIALSAKETVIANGKNFNTTGKSFNQFGDKNKMTMSIAKSYLSGQPKFSLDQIAAYLSEDGMQIEPEDLVEFMLRFPNGTQQALRKKETSFAQDAASKFKKLTGIEITPKNAETLLKKIDKQTEFIINENDWRREVEKIRNERSFYKDFYGGQGKSEEGDGSISKGTGGGGQGARDVEKGKIGEQGKDRNESDRTRTDEVGSARGRARESSEGSSGEVRGVQEAATQIVEDIPVQDSKKGQSTSDDARNIKKYSTKKVEKKIEEQIVSDELDWFSDDKIEAIEELAEPNENKKNCK